jgi:hypothetical protein
VLAVITLCFLGVFSWLAPRAYRALQAEGAAIRALLRNCFGEPRTPQLTPGQEQWLADHALRQLPLRTFDVIATADSKGLRNAIGTLCLTGRQAVFFSCRWRRPVERQIGALTAVEATRGLLLDELLLVCADGRRIRFDLLAGQLKRARSEAGNLSRLSPSV